MRLIEIRSADVAGLPQSRGDAIDEDLVDRIANDLVGARLVVRATLAAAPPARTSGSTQRELEGKEREAGDLLRAVLAVANNLGGRTPG